MVTIGARLVGLSSLIGIIYGSPMRTTLTFCLTLGLAACKTPEPPKPVGPRAELLAPEKATLTAPATYKAKFTTTKGDFVIEVHRDWAPNGADRFFNLLKIGYYDDVAFYRAIEGFMVQLGINGSPEVNAKWRTATIPDDGPTQSNKKGFVTFAKGGPNSRTTQFFINYADNGRLDPMGFPPFGQVVEGMNVVESLYKGYGEGAPSGNGPMQMRIQAEGNTYLKNDFSKLDYVKTARVVD
jgi:peptidyl-prolyl cis-trans isomerase A (cyclophilin A)